MTRSSMAHATSLGRTIAASGDLLAVACGHLPARHQRSRRHPDHHRGLSGQPGRGNRPARARTPVTRRSCPGSPASTSLRRGPGTANGRGVRQAMPNSVQFYRLLAELAGRAGGPRLLRDCRAGDCPRAGVYFFFEDHEVRGDDSSRVVRVGTHALTATASVHLVGPAPAAPRAPGRPRPRQRQPPGLGLPASRRCRAHPARRAATRAARILARPPRPPPRLGRRRNRSRDSGQPAHRRHACALPCCPGPRHPRVRRAEQHRAHLPSWPLGRTRPAPAGSATMPSPARSASRDCGTSSTSRIPATPASCPPSNS